MTTRFDARAQVTIAQMRPLTLGLHDVLRPIIPDWMIANDSVQRLAERRAAHQHIAEQIEDLLARVLAQVKPESLVARQARGLFIERDELRVWNTIVGIIEQGRV